MKRRSIGERLNRAKTAKVKQEIAVDWAANWHAEQQGLITRLEQAIKTDNFDELCIATGQLKTVTEKRFSALPNVITTLSTSEDE